MGNFYKELDFKYSEIGILLEDAVMKKDKETQEWHKTKSTYKVIIPILMPDMYSEEAIDKNMFHDTVSAKASNYFELNIPTYLFPNPEFVKKTPVIYEDDTEDNDKTVVKTSDKVIIPKGTKVIVIFVGGSVCIEDIKVIGLYDDII